MESTIEKTDNAVIVNVDYESLDARSADFFRDELAQSIDGGDYVVLDLQKVQFIDSAGLGIIVSEFKRLQANGGDMAICHVNETVRALFELVRMHRLVHLHDTREAALQHAPN